MAEGDNSINPTGNASMSSVQRRLDTRFGEMSVRALTVVQNAMNPDQEQD